MAVNNSLNSLAVSSQSAFLACSCSSFIGLSNVRLKSYTQVSGFRVPSRTSFPGMAAKAVRDFSCPPISRLPSLIHLNKCLSNKNTGTRGKGNRVLVECKTTLLQTTDAAARK